MNKSNWFKPISLARFADEVAFSSRTCFETIRTNTDSCSQNGFPYSINAPKKEFRSFLKFFSYRSVTSWCFGGFC